MTSGRATEDMAVEEAKKKWRNREITAKEASDVSRLAEGYKLTFVCKDGYFTVKRKIDETKLEDERFPDQIPNYWQCKKNPMGNHPSTFRLLYHRNPEHDPSCLIALMAPTSPRGEENEWTVEVQDENADQPIGNLLQPQAERDTFDTLTAARQRAVEYANTYPLPESK